MAGNIFEDSVAFMIDGQTFSLISTGANLAAAMLALTLGLALMPAGALRLRTP